MFTNGHGQLNTVFDASAFAGATMKLSTTGHVIHFYFVSGKRLTKAVLILGLLLVLSCTLVLTIPEFSLHRPGFRISSSPILAIAQGRSVRFSLVRWPGRFAGGLRSLLVLARDTLRSGPEKESAKNRSDSEDHTPIRFGPGGWSLRR
jgi:hypothetical protein